MLDEKKARAMTITDIYENYLSAYDGKRVAEEHIAILGRGIDLNREKALGELHRKAVIVECPYGVREGEYNIGLKLLNKPEYDIPYVTRMQKEGIFWYIVGKLPEPDIDYQRKISEYYRTMMSVIKDF